MVFEELPGRCRGRSDRGIRDEECLEVVIDMREKTV